MIQRLTAYFVLILLGCLLVQDQGAIRHLDKVETVSQPSKKATKKSKKPKHHKPPFSPLIRSEAPPSAVAEAVGVPAGPTEEIATDVFVPIVVNGRATGDDQVKIRASTSGEVNLESIFGQVLLDHLERVLSKEAMADLKSKKLPQFLGENDFKELEIGARYDVETGSIAITVPEKWLKVAILDMEFFRDSKLIPNTDPDFISGFINARLGYQRYKGYAGDEYQDSKLFRYDGAVHALGATLQGGVVDDGEKIRRLETSLSVPFQDGTYMFIVGDNKYRNGRAINTPELSGYAFFKNAQYKGSQQQVDGGYIELEHKSKIEIYRNEKIFRTLNADPGKFYLSNLPLEVGQNIIRIRVTDLITGTTTEKVVEEYMPLTGVPKGEIEAAMAYGQTRRQDTGEIVYYGNPVTFAGLMYGVTNTYNLGGLGFLQGDYSRGSIDQRLIQPLGTLSLLFNFSQTKNVNWGSSIAGTYTVSFGQKAFLRNIAFGYERAGAGYQDAQFAPDQGFAKGRGNLTINPFGSSSIIAAYERSAQPSGEKEFKSISMNQPFRFNKNWSGDIGIGRIWGSESSDDFRLFLTLTYNDWFGPVRGEASVNNDTLKGFSSVASLSHQTRDADYRASYISNAGEPSASEIYGTKDFTRAKITGRAMSRSDGTRTGGEGLFETAIAFTNHTMTLSAPLSDSFLIFESEAPAGVEFEVLDSNSKSIAESGSFFRSVAVPVHDFSTSSFTPQFFDPSYFTLDSTQTTIYRAGYKSGSTKRLTSDDRILVMFKAVDEKNEPIVNTSGKVVCEKAQDVFYDALFTGIDGRTEYYAKRGAKCYVQFGNFKTSMMELNWPAKYRDFGDMPVK